MKRRDRLFCLMISCYQLNLKHSHNQDKIQSWSIMIELIFSQHIQVNETNRRVVFLMKISNTFCLNNQSPAVSVPALNSTKIQRSRPTLLYRLCHVRREHVIMMVFKYWQGRKEVWIQNRLTCCQPIIKEWRPPWHRLIKLPSRHSRSAELKNNRCHLFNIRCNCPYRVKSLKMLKFWIRSVHIGIDYALYFHDLHIIKLEL